MTSLTENEMQPLVRDLLSGAIEMHVHGAPDIVPRKETDIGLLKTAKSFGLFGVVIKCHAMPTSARAALAEEAVDGIRAFGGIVLNKPVGGLNPAAVEAELAMGGKVVWLPTQSAINDIAFHKRVTLAPVPLTDDEGRFLPELHEILELVAQKDVILATGHISYKESEQIVTLAKDKGVKKIVITHPEAPRINMPVEVQKKLARQGAVFEWVAFNMSTITAGRGKHSPDVYARYIRNVGVESSIIATDFGQPINFSPAEGLGKFIEALLMQGFSPEEISIMIKDNPRKILEL